MEYNIISDLMIEVLDELEKKEGILVEEREENGIFVTKVVVDEKNQININKKKGEYITIQFDVLNSTNEKEDLKRIVTEEITKILKNNKISEYDSGLIVGLGNNNSTPDALGPKVIDKISNVTSKYVTKAIESIFGILEPLLKDDT